MGLFGCVHNFFFSYHNVTCPCLVPAHANIRDSTLLEAPSDCIPIFAGFSRIHLCRPAFAAALQCCIRSTISHCFPRSSTASRTRGVRGLLSAGARPPERRLHGIAAAAASSSQQPARSDDIERSWRGGIRVVEELEDGSEETPDFFK